MAHSPSGEPIHVLHHPHERSLVSFLNGISGISLPPPTHPCVSWARSSCVHISAQRKIALLFVLLLVCYICSLVSHLSSSLPSRRRWQYFLLVSNGFKSLLTWILQVCKVVCAEHNLKHKFICLVCALQSLAVVFWSTFTLCCQFQGILKSCPTFPASNSLTC